MSRAFVKEQDGEALDDLPDRAISEHPNFRMRALVDEPGDGKGESRH